MKRKKKIKYTVWFRLFCIIILTNWHIVVYWATLKQDHRIIFHVMTKCRRIDELSIAALIMKRWRVCVAVHDISRRATNSRRDSGNTHKKNRGELLYNFYCTFEHFTKISYSHWRPNKKYDTPVSSFFS